jgi:hypothetical protein
MITPEGFAEMAKLQGWEKFRPRPVSVSEDLKRQNEEWQGHLDRAQRYLNTPDGQHLLGVLIKLTIMRPLLQPWDLNQTPEQHGLYAAYREGQNAVVEMMRRMAGEKTAPPAEPSEGP